MDKVIKIIAGPNGSGKSTFADSYLNQTKPAVPFLNPDLIATGFGPSNFEKASFQAGRVLLSEIKMRIQRGESFSFESTLSGLTYVRILSEAKANGYKIIIYFIFLNKISLNIARIKKRVQMGGHNIPTQVVKRRYLRCFENFWNLYKELSDQWIVIDNSSKKPNLIQNSLKFKKLDELQKNKFAAKFVKGAL
jgi:predicted ABC-type ATPase